VSNSLLLTWAVDLHGFVEEHFPYKIKGCPKNNLAASQIPAVTIYQFLKMIT
jgi:hypothetical protein